MSIKTSDTQGADRIIWVKERQNQLTGDHLNKLTYHSNKKAHLVRAGSYSHLHSARSDIFFLNYRWWQGTRDSNPNQRFWRAVCYHYTNPLYGGRNKIRTCGGVTLAAFPRRCFKPLSHSSIYIKTLFLYVNHNQNQHPHILDWSF